MSCVLIFLCVCSSGVVFKLFSTKPHRQWCQAVPLPRLFLVVSHATIVPQLYPLLTHFVLVVPVPPLPPLTLPANHNQNNTDVTHEHI